MLQNCLNIYLLIGKLFFFFFCTSCTMSYSHWLFKNVYHRFEGVKISFLNTNIYYIEDYY